MASPTEPHRSPQWEPVQIFGESVLLPPGSRICNTVGKLVEVDTPGYDFSIKDLHKLQQGHPNLLVEWIDREVLCFQIPSSSGTDLASHFEGQIHSYLLRHNKISEIDTRPSSSLFKATAPNAQGKRICADLTIFDRRNYDQKLDAAYVDRRTVPDGVCVYATFEVQSMTQTEEDIRDACRKESEYMGCIAVAILVKTGYVEIHNATQTLYRMHNPLYFDVGHFCPDLQGLRLYLDPLRYAHGWRFPKHAHSYCRQEDLGIPYDTLLKAIQGEDFVLAENVVNYVDSFRRDERPLLEAVKKAVEQAPGADEFVQYLLANGAQPSRDMQSMSAMLIATAAQNQRMINLLRQHGAPYPDVGSDLLVAAVRKEDVDFVTCLIRAGADPNQGSSSGRLALVEALPSMVMVEAIVNTAGHVEFAKKDFRGSCVLTHARRLLEIRQFMEEKIRESRDAVRRSGRGRGATGRSGRGRGGRGSSRGRRSG